MTLLPELQPPLPEDDPGSIGAIRGSARRSFGQRAARWSWVLAVMAIVFGAASNPARNSGDRYGATALALISVSMIALGLLFSVVALLGMKRWGRGGVLRPAVCGFVVCTFYVGLMVVGYRPMMRLQGIRRQQQIKQAEREGYEAGLQDGWVGLYEESEIQIVVMTVPSDAAFAHRILSNLTTPASLALIGMQNRSGRALTIDPRGGVCIMADGARHRLLDNARLFSTAKEDVPKLLANQTPPFEAGSQHLTNKLLFISADTDPREITAFELNLNGKPIQVVGQFVTANEKARRVHEAGLPQRHSDSRPETDTLEPAAFEQAGWPFRKMGDAKIHRG